MRRNYLWSRLSLGLFIVCAFAVSAAGEDFTPFTEDFEHAGLIPNGWTQESVTDTASWIFKKGGHGSPQNSHGGVYNALLYASSASDHKTKLVTPMIDFGTNTAAQLTFWLDMKPYLYTYQDNLSVFYKTSAGGSWTLLGKYTSASSWTQIKVTLPTPNRSYYIAFEGNAKGGYGVCLDDIMVSASAAPTAPAITSGGALPSNMAGTAYCKTLTASGGMPPYTWSILSGSLPSGLSLSADGIISGTPVAATNASFVVKVAGSDSLFSTSPFTLTINPAPTMNDPAYAFTNFVGLPGSAGSTDNTNSAARFNSPVGVSVDGTGNLFVGDWGNHTIRQVTPTGVVTTLAGSAGYAGSCNGTGSVARFTNPAGVAAHTNGNVYVADENRSTIRQVTAAGVVTTLAGSAGYSGDCDGTGSAAMFYSPAGVAVDNAGNVFVADTVNCTIRKVTPEGVVTTLAGLANQSGSADGTNDTARFNYPEGLAVDNSGNIFVADTFNNTIRKVTPAGVVTTVAGNVGVEGSTDGINSAAQFYFPSGIAVDNAGNLFVADKGNHTIRKVSPTGTVTTIGGLAGVTGSTDEIGYAARFYSPAGIAVDSAGTLYVADSSNHRITKGTPILPGLTYTDNGTSVTITGYTGSGGAVTIPGTINGLPVTSIGNYAFFRCYNLTSITLPSSVTSIGNYAFSFCFRMTSITLPASITSIGNYAFDNCSRLTNITLPGSIISIGNWAFNACESLTSVTIPDGTTSIGNCAFYDCYSLSSVIIPGSVTSIGVNAFQGCTILTEIKVDALNSVYSSVDGILFNKNHTTLILYPQGKVGTSYTIPTSVTGIGDSAFYSCYRLTNVTIPNGVTSIGGWAFRNCTGLTSITLPDSIISIDSGAFYYCSGLTNVSIPDSVTSIGDWAFAWTSCLTIAIPASVTSIEVCAFTGCGDLTSITVDPQNSFYSSIDGVLFNKNKTMLIAYPGGKAGSYTIPDSVTGIAECAFRQCTKMTSVTVPASVTSIGDGALMECNLAGVYFQGNAPSFELFVFGHGSINLTVYYLSGTTGWPTVPNTWDGCPTALWNSSFLLAFLDKALADNVSEVIFPCDGTIDITETKVISSDITLDATGHSVTISGGNAVRVLTVNPGVHLTLRNLTIADGNSASFGGGIYNNGGKVTAVDCNFTNNAVVGEANGGNSFGGAIYNCGNGSLILTNCTFANNSATGGIGSTGISGGGYGGYGGYGYGGGISNSGGEILITNCTFSGNRAIGGAGGVGGRGFDSYQYWNGQYMVTVPGGPGGQGGNGGNGNGGGLYNSSGTVTMVNVTMARGSAGGGNGGAPGSPGNYGYGNYGSGYPGYNSSGGNIGITSGTVTLKNTIIAYGFAGFTPNNCSGMIVDNGNNICSDTSAFFSMASSRNNIDPLLATELAANGGNTMTIALLIQSPAINAGDDNAAPTTDQRHFPRAGQSDIGAYEFPTPAISSFAPTSGLVGTNVAINGVNFNGVTAVRFGGADATFTTNSTSLITTVVPPNAVSGLITVVTSNGTVSSPTHFIVELPFVYTTNDGAISITSYTGSGGAVYIPSMIDGLPVTSIGDSAFAYRISLTSITIPDSVTSIGAGAFLNCYSLSTITVDESNSFYSSVNGVLFNEDKTTLIAYPNGKAGSYTIPSSVTSIGDSAFYGCYRLTNVTIPSSITSIGDWAFYGCSGLTSVTIPDSVTSIGDGAFYWCTGLTGITIPDSVTSIGYSAFSWCTGLTSITIPDSVTSIGDYAFSECTSLTSMTIPDSVTSIGDYAFWNCTSLTSATIGSCVTSIGECAFVGCFSLTSMTIPDSVTSIGNYAFNGCGLTSVTIGNSVTSIGDWAFYGCSGLTSVTIPDSVTSIGDGAFLTSIGDSAFYFCPALTSATFLGNAPSMGTQVFDSYASNFTVYYVEGARGFTSPTWMGYSSETVCKLTYNAGVGGAVTGTTPQLVKHGADGTAVTAIPSTGYHFVKWSDDVMTESRTDTNITANKTVTADFAINQYTLTYIASANGTFTGMSPQTINHGSSGTAITAVANTGYHFTEWSDGVETTSRTDMDITANLTVTAAFAINTYTVIFDLAGKGAITGGGELSQTVNHGSVALAPTLSANTGWNFTGWDVAFDNITANLTVTALYSVVTYSVTFVEGANGTITGTKDQTINHGLDCSAVTALPGTGYHFVNWTGDYSGTANPLTITAVTANKTITANFAINSVSILTSLDNINVSEGGTATFGVKLSAQPTASRTVTVAKLSGDGDITILPVSSLTFTTSDWDSYQTVTLAAAEDADTANGSAIIRCSSDGMNDKDVSATESDNDYTLTVNNDGNGTTVPSGAGIVTKGSATSISATPGTGYHLVNWTVTSGAAIFNNSNPASPTVTASSDATIRANFAIDTYTVIFELSENGTRTGGGELSQTINHGSAATEPAFNAKPGWTFNGWDITFDNITSNLTVTAHWIIGPPVISDPGSQKAMVGVLFNLQLTVESESSTVNSVTVSGLPSGLKYDVKTMTIAGVPTVAVNKTVTVTAKNSFKTPAVQTFTITVDPLPAWASGTFNGSCVVNGDYGAATMTVTALGKITGKLSASGKNYAFSTVSYERRDEDNAFWVSTEILVDKAPLPLIIRVTNPAGVEPPNLSVAEGWFSNTAEGDPAVKMYRNVWKDKDVLLAATLKPYTGYYTAVLPGSAEYGSGYLTLTVDNAGGVKTTGKLADGTALSLSGPLILDENQQVFAVIYASPTAYKGGCMFGLAKFAKPEGGGKMLLSILDEKVKFIWENRNPQATAEYEEGFCRELELVGGWYDKTENLYDYYQGKTLTVGADAGAPAPVLTVGVNHYTAAWWNFSGIAITPAFGKAGVMTGLIAPKAGAPLDPEKDNDWDYGAENAVGLKIGLTRATGVFKGSFKAWFDYGKTHTSKSILYEGVLIPDWEDTNDVIEGRGFFLWADKEPWHQFKLSYDFIIQSTHVP